MFLLALLGKTAVVPLPVVLLGLAWWQRGRIAVKDLKNCLVFVVLAAAGSLMAVVIQHGAAAGLQVRPDNIWVRLAGAGWALWVYLWKALVPLNLNFVYPRWDIQAQNPLSYLPLALWVGGLWICWRFRRTWGRGVVFAMGYFTVMLLPVLGLVSIYFMRYSLVADHWQYFAIIGPIALLAAGIKTRLAAVNWASPFLPPSFCAVVLLTFGALTWRQCGIYGGVETLWRATLAQNPGSFLANNNLGTLLRQSGRVDEAITHYQAALLVEPDDESIHFNLAKAYFQRGMFDQAILQFQRALQIAPADMEAENNLAWLLATSPQASLRDGAKAVQLARRANDLAGGKNPVVLGTLAAALAETGNFGDAVAVSQKAVSAAEAEGRRDLTGPLNAQLLRYKAGLPWHQ